MASAEEQQAPNRSTLAARDEKADAVSMSSGDNYVVAPEERMPPTPGLEQPPESGSDSTPTDTDKAQDGKPVESEEPERSKGKIALIMMALCLAVFLAALDITIIATALPTISAHFHSTAGYTWIGSAYTLAAASATPIWGKISDIWGRKPVLLLANAVFFAGSLIAALSINIGMLIAARAIQGLAAGGLIVLVNICIGDLFSQRRRGAYYGIIGGVWAVASSLGPVIGGAFSEKVTWRWCFYINLPVDGVAFAIILFFLDIKTPTTPFVAGIKAIDWLGSFFIVTGTLLFLFGLEYGGVTFPWASATVICLLVFGVLTWALFFVAEWKFAKYPIMPLRIFRYRSNIASLVVCYVHGFVFISGAYYLPLYFQAVLGATPILSGAYILAQSFSMSVSSIATGIFIRKTGQYIPPILVGVCLMTLGYGLFIDLDARSSWAKIILYQVVSGLGVGPNFQAPLIALQSLIQPRDIATATSTFGFVRNIATSMSIVVGGVVFQNEIQSRAASLASQLPPALAARLGGSSAGANVALIRTLPPDQRAIVADAFADSLTPMWIVYTAFSVVGVVAGLLVTRQTLQKTHQETRTGLAAEEENRLQAKEEEAARRRE